MITKEYFKQNIITLIFILLLPILSLSDDAAEDKDPILDIIELKESGKISSLEDILGKLSSYHINRLLEVELKQGVNSQDTHPFIYEIEYIDNQGFVLEIEVDALTARILNIEREH